MTDNKQLDDDVAEEFLSMARKPYDFEPITHENWLLMNKGNIKIKDEMEFKSIKSYKWDLAGKSAMKELKPPEEIFEEKKTKKTNRWASIPFQDATKTSEVNFTKTLNSQPFDMFLRNRNQKPVLSRFRSQDSPDPKSKKVESKDMRLKEFLRQFPLHQ